MLLFKHMADNGYMNMKKIYITVCCYLNAVKSMEIATLYINLQYSMLLFKLEDTIQYLKYIILIYITVCFYLNLPAEEQAERRRKPFTLQYVSI